MAPQMMISSHEVNALVYSYLQDSGFTHTAFSFLSEARLNDSPCFGKHINRGELIELLVKALLYTEAETHFRGPLVNQQCKAAFSLLEKHQCSQVPPPPSSHTIIRPHSDGLAAQIPPATIINSVLSTQTSTQPGSSTNPPNALASAPPSNSKAISSAKPESNIMEVDQPVASSSQLPDLNMQSKKSTKPKGKKIKQNEKADPGAILTLKPIHTGEVFVVAWHPKVRNLLATGTKDAQVKFWMIPTDPVNAQPPTTIKLILRANTPGDLTSLCWNNEGTLLAVGAYDSVLRIYEKSGVLHWQSAQHKGPIFAVKFSPNGDQLLTGSLDRTVCLWSTSQKKMLRQYAFHKDSCLDVEWIDNTTFSSCGADGFTFLYRTNSSKCLKTLNSQTTSEITLVRRNPQGTRLGTCSDDFVARIWNVEKDNITRNDGNIPGLGDPDEPMTLRGHRAAISGLRWHPNPTFGPHPLVVTSAFDGTARIWDSVTGEVIKAFSEHKRPIYALTISPDGRWLATAAGDGYLHVYSFITYEKVWSWFSEKSKPGIFEAEWQVDETGRVRWIGLALESKKAVVIDITKVPQLQI